MYNYTEHYKHKSSKEGEKMTIDIDHDDFDKFCSIV